MQFFKKDFLKQFQFFTDFLFSIHYKPVLLSLHLFLKIDT